MEGAAHHLLTVWNPSYASDAMDEHLRVLIDWAGRAQAGEAERDDIYVWWGKIRSPNRKGALPHADAIAVLDEQVRSGTETHLHLTDYRSRYVAWVGEITAEHLPKDQPDELDHIPAYYRDQFADFWFQLWDIRRPHGLRRITGIGNPAAHTRATTRDGVGKGRNEILGIGCEGIVVRLARTKMRS